MFHTHRFARAVPGRLSSAGNVFRTDSMTRSGVSQCWYIHLPRMNRRPCSDARNTPVGVYYVCRFNQVGLFSCMTLLCSGAHSR